MAVDLPVCRSLPVVPDPLAVELPGGATLRSVINAAQTLPSECDLGFDLLGTLGAAMTPLSPFFKQLDAVLAIVECVKAIPDALGPPPDPSKLTACIPELQAKVDELLKLIPQLSIPRLARSLLDVLVRLLTACRDKLGALAEEQQRLLALADRAARTKNPKLAAIVDCARANVDTTIQNGLAGFESLGGVIRLANTLLGMAGLPEIPPLAGMTGTDATKLVEQLDPVIDGLRAARDATPLP